MENHFKVTCDTGGQFESKASLHKPIPTLVAGRPATYQIHGSVNAPHAGKGRASSVDKPSPTIIAKQGNVELRRSTKISDDDVDISDMPIGREYDSLLPGGQSDKYFSLQRADAKLPSPTLTAIGGVNRGIATVVHPFEKRKFTIAEVVRLCSFPDDFKLEGSYSQQWERLGNSVPPLMMRAVAEALRDGVLLPARSGGPAARSPGRSTSGKRRTGVAPGKARPASGTAADLAGAGKPGRRSRRAGSPASP